jgi:hypothetical protein
VKWCLVAVSHRSKPRVAWHNGFHSTNHPCYELPILLQLHVPLLLLLPQMPLDDIQSLMDETAEAKEYQVGLVGSMDVGKDGTCGVGCALHCCWSAASAVAL